MKVIVKPDGVVVKSGTDVYAVENGIYCDGTVYGEPGLGIQEVFESVVPFKHKIIAGIVSINPEWQATEEGIRQTSAQEILDLKDRLTAAEADNLTTLEALADVYEMMLPLLG